MNSSMSKSCCTNCNVLHSKCSILQEQVKILTDKLTELILHDKAYNNDISVQCNLPLPSESVEVVVLMIWLIIKQILLKQYLNFYRLQIPPQTFQLKITNLNRQ